MSDRELIAGLKQGSPEAYRELVGSYGRRLYSVGLRLLRNPQDAEDVVQETLLKAFQAIDSFREDSSLYTWLYRIACNESLMKLRARGRQQTVPIDPYLPKFEEGHHVEAIEDWSGLPDRMLESQELSEFFERCVDELPEEYRVAYVLKDVEKLSEEQVCRILKLTKPAMKNRVHRARLVIRQRIEERFLKPASQVSSS